MGTHGDFVWYELMTTDPEAAQAFYSGLLGWSFEDSSFNETDYRTFSGSKGQVGGFLGLSEEMISGGSRPAWLGYIDVDDLDAAIDKIKRHGGSVAFGPGEVPGVGPFAMVMGPQGAPFYLIDDQSGEPSVAYSKHEPTVGHCAWNELMTADPSEAKTAYEDLFGWVVGDTMEMGPMGTYDMMKRRDADFMLGAIMKKPDEMPVSIWSYYFRVPDIDEAVAYIGANGAQIINGPMEIPGGDFALSGIDPQGAMFSLVGARKG
ncbi:MAG: VOC family protein [Sphingomonadaceae bacterium]